jgi:hypothetical protein
MARRLLATLAGLAVAIAIIVGNEYIGAWLFPPPAGLDRHDKAALSAFVASLPVGAFAVVLAGWFLATLVGGWVALRSNGVRGQARPAMMVALALLAAAVTDMMSFRHPAWFWVATFVVIPAGAWLSIRAYAANSATHASPQQTAEM